MQQRNKAKDTNFERKFIILDRDGVINYDSEDYIKSPDEWVPIPGSLEAIAKLNQAGFRILIATNQSGISRGLYDFQMLELIHEKLAQSLGKKNGKIEEIFYCPHQPLDDCYCRKPKPGLIEQMQNKYCLTLSDTFYIGDSAADIALAQSVGAKPMLVLTGNGLKHCHEFEVPQFSDLATAVEAILFNQNCKD